MLQQTHAMIKENEGKQMIYFENLSQK